MTTTPLASETGTPVTNSHPAGDQFGRIEARGIDYVPDSERHGRARELFTVWAASNITYLYVVLGGTMIVLGLNASQAMAVVLAGNAFWVLVGLLAVSGPSSGTPSSVVMRSMFGIRANRVNVAVVGWVISVAYEAPQSSRWRSACTATPQSCE
jgi:NCS1 family nucleobase:cation symporter-1